MKLYGAYSELEDYGMVSWHVVGFNLDFGEFWPVKTLHSRDAAEDLAKKLNVEDHGSGNNQSVMQEFSKYLELRKPPIKAPFSTSGEPCICHYPMKYEDWCFYCGGNWENRSYDNGEPKVQDWRVKMRTMGWPWDIKENYPRPGIDGPVPQADGDGRQVTKFPMQTPLDNPPEAKWYSLDQLFPRGTPGHPDNEMGM